MTLRENMTLSAVVEITDAAKLDETLFSLAIQDWADLEIVFATINPEATHKIDSAFNAQPWQSTPRYKVISPGATHSSQNHAALLNQCVAETTGRFLTFLRTRDGIVYQRGYAALIARMLESRSGLMVGACRTACVRDELGFVEAKYDFTLRSAALRLLGQSIAPLCCHVIDRSRVPLSALKFAERGDSDRNFLSNLYASIEPDFSLRNVFVCERRLRAGSLENVLYEIARRGYVLRQALRQRLSRGTRRHNRNGERPAQNQA